MNAQEIRALKKEAHALKPVVRVGNKGVTEAVCLEVETALDAHGLIKIKLPQERDGMLDRLVKRTKAVSVGEIGHTVILYRKKVEKDD